MKKLTIALMLMCTSASADEYIGNLSGNMFDGESINNEFALINNPFYPYSLTNSFGPYGNEFSPYSPKNEFSTMGPRLYGGPFDEDPE